VGAFGATCGHHNTSPVNRNRHQSPVCLGRTIIFNAPDGVHDWGLVHGRQRHREKPPVTGINHCRATTTDIGKAADN
jgi:hypothetical protein